MSKVITDAWSEYLSWNEAIAEVLFPEVDDPQPVYLDLEDEAVEQLGLVMDVPVEDVRARLADSVRSTLGVGGPSAVFHAHERQLARWVGSGRRTVPPFLGVLAVFCEAAEQMAAADGMSSSNFLGRLQTVLGRPGDKSVDQAYRRVAELWWGHLNRWLVDQDGARGMPTAFALSHRFVGLTVSQALVRSADRENLKDFFTQFGLAPGAELPPSELTGLIDTWMHQVPCPVSGGLFQLWQKKDARERIAQSTSVALSTWDGRGRQHVGHVGGGPGSRPAAAGIQLTLKIDTFPRKRLGLGIQVRFPRADEPREAKIVTAEPPVAVDLVPDLPGSLSIGRGSSVSPADALRGLLRLEDSLTGASAERKPKRLVLFREDALTRQWVEAPQVMLGEDVQLLVHDSVRPRLLEVLVQVARPGWVVSDPLPGQPDDWSRVEGVQVMTPVGDLVHQDRVDDLQPLVPLTSSSLKLAGGFALPGQLRSKWHVWGPPEIRAISDSANGFVVRVIDLGRFEDGDVQDPETVLEEWVSDGALLVRSMADLDLADGDYRVELLARGKKDPLTASTVRLRSSDTPDRRQWSRAAGVSYTAGGAGVLGVEGPRGARVSGHVVDGERRSAPDGLQDLPPAAPWWRAGEGPRSHRPEVEVRLTTVDPSSCLYTGRHRVHVETPDYRNGRPVQSRTWGECLGCGMRRLYPTGHRQAVKLEVTAGPAGTRHDVTELPPRRDSDNDLTTAFDALLHTGRGSWAQLERILFQVEPSGLFVDQVARTLEVLGHLDVRRDARTLEPVAWEVAPTSLVGTEHGTLFGGFWPTALYTLVGEELSRRGAQFDECPSTEGVTGYFVDLGAEQLRTPTVVEQGVSVVDTAWRDLVQVLPPLSEVLRSLPRTTNLPVGQVTQFAVSDNTWRQADGAHDAGAYRVRKFATTDLFRAPSDVEAGTWARSTVQLSKHLAAHLVGRSLVAWHPEARRLTVPLGADLPGLYGRVVVAASGLPPVAERKARLLHYEDVPDELARALQHLLTH
ncbi:hypothetical protein [Nocardioides sp. GY 10127]|uniref:hypothetical protein n=1 Tax=Nocardioides sp. GY 10127 TaxID=2569762 RepID=UPI0010A8AA53|nr:hypothetical protein [Nocardioides sp. GY 10127]TIC84435.1 hypothetical protein E8D37_06635 [Nocardioides sp. GY 10127]